MPQINVSVTQKVIEADSIVRFVFESLPGYSLPSFSPGAHIDVEVGEKLVRQYSLCNSEGEKPASYQIAVLKDANSRGGSQGLHALETGQQIKIGLPRNSFPLSAHSRTVLLAAGIGITPLMPMAYELTRTARHFELHYSCRRQASAAFYQELLASTFADKTTFYFSEGSENKRVDFESIFASQNEGTHFYICGPHSYIQAAIEAAERLNIANTRIHTESFQPAPDSVVGGSFNVQISSTGQVFEIPENVRVSDILQEHGFDLAISCEQGICGACVLPVLSGVIDHRDTYLTDAERDMNDQMTICCSRGKGLIVLGC